MTVMACTSARLLATKTSKQDINSVLGFTKATESGLVSKETFLSVSSGHRRNWSQNVRSVSALTTSWRIQTRLAENERSLTGVQLRGSWRSAVFDAAKSTAC